MRPRRQVDARVGEATRRAERLARAHAQVRVHVHQLVLTLTAWSTPVSMSVSTSSGTGPGTGMCMGIGTGVSTAHLCESRPELLRLGQVEGLAAQLVRGEQPRWQC